MTAEKGIDKKCIVAYEKGTIISVKIILIISIVHLLYRMSLTPN